ncbi:CaiB/BaiF CoA transferase family protein [Peterkaempfera bronchialis]|uniref:CoA transferase n=2 Tax=Peterkaempfera bronchialis TaxID=2126346 RepID=A0A345SRD6_9ACTN|nr:CoA transferase [Peterkaempfera bronchialis]
MAGVLQGVRVVEIASWTFVPSTGAVLADWGADVIKVEDVRGGDPGRSLVISGLRRGDAKADRDFMMEIGNRGKRSIGLDLRTETGRDILARLVKSADVFLTNWLPDARRRLKIDVEDIRAINPDIIYARGSGHGPRGPQAHQGGFDAASYMARGGVAFAVTPPENGRPIAQTPAFGDLPSGMTLAGGIAAALYRRLATGTPSVVDVSLLSQAVWTMSPDIMAAEFFGVERTAMTDSSLSPNPVVQKYRTSDGRWIQLVFLQPDRYWDAFVRRIGRPELADDPRFTPSSRLIANAEAATAELNAVFAEHDLDHWTKALADEEGVWAVVASPREVLSDPQALANDYFIANVDEAGVEYRMAGSPVQFDERPPAPARAPEHGEHTEEILLEFGLSWAEIAVAKDSGAVL